MRWKKYDKIDKAEFIALIILFFIVFNVATLKISIPIYEFELSDKRTDELEQYLNTYSWDMEYIINKLNFYNIKNFYKKFTGNQAYFYKNWNEFKFDKNIEDKVNWLWKSENISIFTQKDWVSLIDFWNYGYLYLSKDIYNKCPIKYWLWKVRRIINEKWRIIEHCSRATCSWKKSEFKTYEDWKKKNERYLHLNF